LTNGLNEIRPLSQRSGNAYGASAELWLKSGQKSHAFYSWAAAG